MNDRFGDGIAAALAFFVIGVATVFVEPGWGITSAGSAIPLPKASTAGALSS